MTRRSGGGCWSDPAERARIATDGWGARLLAFQDDDGNWGDGIYSPKWTSTTYTLLHLMWLGLEPGHPAALRGCERLWEWQSRWRVPETCIESMLVRLTCYFGYDAPRLEDAVADLLDQQLADGGWNCAHEDGEGQAQLVPHQHPGAGGAARVRRSAGARRTRTPPSSAAASSSSATGSTSPTAPVRSPSAPAPASPPSPSGTSTCSAGWSTSPRCGAPAHEELSDAVDVLVGARRKDGRWSTYAQYPGRQWFKLEPSGASRWNTCRALRVLEWWESGFED